jgi:hypothetical protein
MSIPKTCEVNILFTCSECELDLDSAECKEIQANRREKFIEQADLLDEIREKLARKEPVEKLPEFVDCPFCSSKMKYDEDDKQYSCNGCGTVATNDNWREAS